MIQKGKGSQKKRKANYIDDSVDEADLIEKYKKPKGTSLTCNQCKKTFLKKYNLSRHINKVHGFKL